MNQSAFSWHSPDGLVLFGQSWQPDEPPKASACLVHGQGEHSGRYVALATAFTNTGYLVITSRLRFPSWPSRSPGGCHPTSTHRRRAATISPLFNRSAFTVARPTGVTPTILVPSSDHVKWSVQCCRLGLKSDTRLWLTGSTASCFTPLNRLQ